jgi:hypothetical protein
VKKNMNMQSGVEFSFTCRASQGLSPQLQWKNSSHPSSHAIVVLPMMMVVAMVVMMAPAAMLHKLYVILIL